MSDSIILLMLTIFINLPVVATTAEPAISPIYREKGLLFDNFPGYKLSLKDDNFHQRSTSVPDKMGCVFACVGATWCLSVNFNTTVKDGRHACELMSGLMSNKKNLTEDKNFIHLSIKNPCTEKPCHNDGECTINSNRQDYKCNCKTGFSGEKCQNDLDECSSSHGCHSKAVCINTPGSFTCQCEPGFTGNGKQCTDIDECSSSHSCHSNAVCINTPGSFTCQCKPGFTGIGKQCTAFVTTFVYSEGCDDFPEPKCGKCIIKVNNGVDQCPNTRGHNVVVLDKFGVYQSKGAFDTHNDVNAGQRLSNFLNSLPNESIVLIAIMDSGERYVSNATPALRSVGAVNSTAVEYRSTWLLVGYKGGSPSWITEKRADPSKGPIQANVTIPVPVT